MTSLKRPSLSLQRPKSLSVQLAENLGKRIADGDFKPGDKLPSEHEMVVAYGVSRSVVREAISNLKAAGVVSARQGVGIFVLESASAVPFRVDEADLGAVQEVINLLELRIALESEAAALAATRRSEEQIAGIRAALDLMTRCIEAQEDAAEVDFRFHQEIAQAANNRYFTDLFNYLGMMAIPRARIGMFKTDTAARTAYLQNVNREHHEIFHAIANADPVAARAAMRLHLSNSRDRLKLASGILAEAKT